MYYERCLRKPEESNLMNLIFIITIDALSNAPRLQRNCSLYTMDNQKCESLSEKFNSKFLTVNEIEKKSITVNCMPKHKKKKIIDYNFN